MYYPLFIFNTILFPLVITIINNDLFFIYYFVSFSPIFVKFQILLQNYLANGGVLY